MPLEVRSLAEWEAAGIKEMLSVVIPAHNEERHIVGTVKSLISTLNAAGIKFEILVVNDNSDDDTEYVLGSLCREHPELRYVNNMPPGGYGFAVRRGLAQFRGDAVAIVMADGSDGPADLVRFYRKLHEEYDCIFGSRFCREGSVSGYPVHKLVLNRLANSFIQCLFLVRYNRHDQCLQTLQPQHDRGHSTAVVEPFQSYRRDAAQMYSTWLQIRRPAELVAE